LVVWGLVILLAHLVIAWTFLQDNSRKIFQEYLNLDPGAWARARAWAL